MNSSFNDSSATFTDIKREKGEIVDLHASITELVTDGADLRNNPMRRSLTTGDLQELQDSLLGQKLLDSSDNSRSWSKGMNSSFNDSSATFTDAKQEKGEIVDLHASITELNGGVGYENLRMSLTQGDIEDLHASLTELTGAGYEEAVLKRASSAGNAASNNRGFNDSSATFTDHSRDRGEIVDMHASLTKLHGPPKLLPQIDSDNSSGTYTDDERDLDEMQNLHASFTQLQVAIGSDDSSASSADDNASFTDICLNMLRRPDSGAAELDASEEEDDDDFDDDASFTDICINMLRKSESDAKHQQRFREKAKQRRSLSFDATDDDFDLAFDSDNFSYQTSRLQAPPKLPTKPQTKKNAARLRAERWEKARAVFSAKIAEEERMTEEEQPQRMVSLGELPEEFRPKLSQPPEEISEEEKTRLRAEQWKKARELFSEQIAEEERRAKEKLEKQLLVEPSRTVSFDPKMGEQSLSEVEEETAATLSEQDTEESSTEQSLLEQGSEQVAFDEAADFSAAAMTPDDRLDSERTDVTEFSSSLVTLDDRLDSEESQETVDDAKYQVEEQLDDAAKTEPKRFNVTNLPYTGNFGESGMYTGTVNGQYQPTGKGIMMYDNGEELKGYWKNGDFHRESELYSDSEEDDDDDEEEVDDLNSSMADVGAKRDRSRSRSKDRHVAKAPARPFSIGDIGKKSDMLTDKDAAIAIIEKLTFGEGAFIRRSDGNWTYAEVKSFEEFPEGRASIRFVVNEKNSSKSYAKKYWKSHIRPLKHAPKKTSSPSADERTRRGRNAVDSINSSSNDESNRGISCPPVQSRLSFDWPNRRGRSRSRSLRRAVSASPMRALHSISELEKGEEEASEDETETSGQSHM